MIEEDAGKRDPFKVLTQLDLESKKWFAAEREMYGDMVQDIHDIMTEYFAYWKRSSLKYTAVNKKYAEHAFEVEWDDDLLIMGFVDGIGRTPNTLQWLVEHKTFTSLPNEDHRWRNLQSSLYIRIIEELGWAKGLSGVLWNYIKSKPPTIPQMKKNGTPSNKKIVTLPSVINRFLAKGGHSIKDYPNLYQRALDSRGEYFQRIFTPVNRTVVNHIFDGFIDSSRRIADNHGTRSEQNIANHCDWCAYEPLCRAELTGGDVDYLKEKSFEKKPPRTDGIKGAAPADTKEGGSISSKLSDLRKKRNGKNNAGKLISRKEVVAGRKRQGDR